MNSCEVHKSVTAEVAEFISHVPDVKEESITDFLLWKWRDADKRLRSINVSSFTRDEESKVSGADFEMEIWFISGSYVFPLVFQAKKIVKQYNAYVSALRYPNNSKAQLNKLLTYAKKTNRVPFYAFYSIDQSNTDSLCQKNTKNPCGVYIAHAKKVEAFANKKGMRLSRKKIIGSSNPFHCLFCCPLGFARHLTHYYELNEEEFVGLEIPEYIQYLVETHPMEINPDTVFGYIKSFDLDRYRHIAVYNLNEELEA